MVYPYLNELPCPVVEMQKNITPVTKLFNNICSILENVIYLSS